MKDTNWVEDELSSVNIRDVRIVNRLIETTTILSEHPNVSIPEACESWKETKATYRLLDNKKLRDARVSIKYCPVTINLPLKRSCDKLLNSLQLYCILAEEINPPEEVTPISWLLLTTIPIVTLGDVVGKIRWYSQRWKIERYHYVLKSGCNVEELQLETRSRLENALAIYSIIAWRLLWIS